MSACEICGKKRPLGKAVIEGSILSVCDNCVKFGKLLPEPKLTKKEEKEIEEVLIDPSFPTMIKLKREGMGLKIEELAKKVNEKVSTIERIERGRLNPDVKTARKLEKALDIKLIDYEKNS